MCPGDTEYCFALTAGRFQFVFGASWKHLASNWKETGCLARWTFGLIQQGSDVYVLHGEQVYFILPVIVCNSPFVTGKSCVLLVQTSIVCKNDPVFSIALHISGVGQKVLFVNLGGSKVCFTIGPLCSLICCC